MDSSGHIYERLTREERRELERLSKKPLTPLTSNQFATLKPMSKQRRKNHMRNQPCVCGSGIKFKRCCWSKYQ